MHAVLNYMYNCARNTLRILWSIVANRNVVGWDHQLYWIEYSCVWLKIQNFKGDKWSLIFQKVGFKLWWKIMVINFFEKHNQAKKTVFLIGKELPFVWANVLNCLQPFFSDCDTFFTPPSKKLRMKIFFTMRIFFL